MPENTQQASKRYYQGRDGLARLIADSCKLGEIKMAVPPKDGIFRIKDWVHDYIDEILEEDRLPEGGEEEALRTFLLKFPSIDPLAKRLGIKKKEQYNKKLIEVLRRLQFVELRVPRGIRFDLRTIQEKQKVIESKPARARSASDYEDLLLIGREMGERFEYILKMLLIFYGGFFFQRVFNNYFQLDLVTPAPVSGLPKEDLLPEAQVKNIVNEIADQPLKDCLKNFG